MYIYNVYIYIYVYIHIIYNDIYISLRYSGINALLTNLLLAMFAFSCRFTMQVKSSSAGQIPMNSRLSQPWLQIVNHHFFQKNNTGFSANFVGGIHVLAVLQVIFSLISLNLTFPWENTGPQAVPKPFIHPFTQPGVRFTARWGSRRPTQLSVPSRQRRR